MKQSARYISIINDERSQEMAQRINDILVGQKKYRDKGYSALLLSKDLQTNTRYVSVSLRKSFGKNYCQYVNILRVEEAKSMLLNPEMDDMSMEDVSDMVGFATRQSFQTTFQRLVGTSPLKYRKHRDTEITNDNGRIQL